MARMALAGQPQDAIKHARRALALNRNAGDKNEEANSLRLIADAAFKLGGSKGVRNRFRRGVAVNLVIETARIKQKQEHFEMGLIEIL